MIGVYLTHPQVEIDPNVPVPEWGLSSRGRERIDAILGRPWLKGLKRIVASEERKAIETGERIAASLGITCQTFPDMGENDRSATGFLKPDVFERAADAFFAHPTRSWNGWERAVDAQARIVVAVEHVLQAHDSGGDMIFVGHGAVGTLLKCHLARRPISRHEDQQPGGGNVFAFSLADRRMFCDWTPIERFEDTRDDG